MKELHSKHVHTLHQSNNNLSHLIIPVLIKLINQNTVGISLKKASLSRVNKISSLLIFTKVIRVMLIGLLLVMGFFSVKGQKAFSVHSFLVDALRDESVSLQSHKSYYLNTLNYGMPIIEKLEFRTETNDFDISKQEYVFRVSPNTKKSIQTHRYFQDGLKHITNMERNMAFNQELHLRYLQLIEFYYLSQILGIKEEQNELIVDRVTLLRRSIELPNFDIIQLIKAEDNALKHERSLLDIRNSLSSIQEGIRQKYFNLHAIESIQLITIPEIHMFLSSLDEKQIQKHSSMEVEAAKNYNVMLEYELEASNSKFSIGYVQAKYGYDEGNPFASNFSIGIGFDIPIRKTARNEFNKLRIDILESESRYRELKKEVELQIFTQHSMLKNLLSKYQLLFNQLKEGKAEYALQEYQKVAEAPPNALLQLRENTLSNELGLKELELKITLQFITYLEIIGVLSQYPLKNFLSSNFEVFHSRNNESGMN